jgi:hypothetical protein
VLVRLRDRDPILVDDQLCMLLFLFLKKSLAGFLALWWNLFTFIRVCVIVFVASYFYIIRDILVDNIIWWVTTLLISKYANSVS